MTAFALDFGLSEVIPPTYEHIVETYSLDILKGGSDLVDNTCQVILTRGGEARTGSRGRVALDQFVQTWRMNEPHLRSLFEMVAAVKQRQTFLIERIQQVASDRLLHFEASIGYSEDPAFIEAFSDAIDQRESNSYGLGSYASCIIHLINIILCQLRLDVNVKTQDWNEATPCLSGQSVGNVILAAADASQFKDRPTGVVASVYQNVSSRSKSAFGSCYDTLNKLSADGDFDHLARNIFAFAYNLSCKADISDAQ